MSSNQELRVYAWRALALLRLVHVALAFLEIAIELLDQVSFDEVRDVAAGVADRLSVARVGPHTVEELESA